MIIGTIMAVFMLVVARHYNTYIVLRRQIARCKKQFTVTDFYEVKLFCKNEFNTKSTRLRT